MRLLKMFYGFGVLFLFLVGSFQFLDAGTPVAKVSAEVKTGENWIQNKKVKVTIEGKRVSVHIKDVNTDKWELFSSGQLIGLLKTKELMKPYRKKYGVYYLFGKESAVKELKTEIRDGSPVIKYRTSLEELWIDTEIKILKNSGFILIEAIDKSNDSLVPHWSQTFHQRWARNKWWMPAMTHLVFDGSSKNKPGSMAAIDYREQHKFPAFSRYCIAYRPNEKKTWGILWPPKNGKVSNKRKIQFPPGAITAAYLDAPYVMVAEITDNEKNVEGMSKLGDKLYKQMSSFFIKTE